ncbi:MAG: hypothetical protein ACOC1P_06925 [Minisyncoccales bacterium]
MEQKTKEVSEKPKKKEIFVKLDDNTPNKEELKKEKSERFHRRFGFWLFLISFIVFVGILLFMWLF